MRAAADDVMPPKPAAKPRGKTREQLAVLRERKALKKAGLLRVATGEFFRRLKWIDGKPLNTVLEPYRLRIFSDVLDQLAEDGRAKYNLALMGRAKKNWKSADLILAALFCLMENDSPQGNQCYVLANDLDQANDDLKLAKLLVASNPSALGDKLVVRQRALERADGRGFLEILPAGDAVGTHGKTYRFAGYDEIHGYRNWDILEAMQPDPLRADSLQWITSYASLYHRPGVPLFDMTAVGREGTDPRMYYSWYAADFTTDADFRELDPEARANPSMASWTDRRYLAQQQVRLPSHKFRRLHLNLPGLPEGSAYSVEPVMEAVARGVFQREPVPGVRYIAFADNSHGSSDDAALAIGHREGDKLVLDLVVNQGQPAPFSMTAVIPKFAAHLRRYGVREVHGDRVGGETYRQAWSDSGVSYRIGDRTTSELYENLEPLLNNGRCGLVDVALLEQQLLGLVWKGSKITHPAGEHDDLATAAAGCLSLLAGVGAGFVLPTTGFARNFTPSYTSDAAPAADEGSLHPHERVEWRAAVIAAPRGYDVDNVEHRTECRACRAAWRSWP